MAKVFQLQYRLSQYRCICIANLVVIIGEKSKMDPQIKEPCRALAILKGNMKFYLYIKIIKFYQLVSAKTMDKKKKKKTIWLPIDSISRDLDTFHDMNRLYTVTSSYRI